MTFTIKVTGIEGVSRKLNIVEGLRKGIGKAILYLKGKVAIYPPATEANQPGRTDAKGNPMSWYVRGTGTYTPSGMVYRTSQTLGKQWTTRTEHNGLVGVVGNSVPYAPYVQDRDHQAWFHKLRGWRTVQNIGREEMEAVKKILKDAILAFMNKKG